MHQLTNTPKDSLLQRLLKVIHHLNHQNRNILNLDSQCREQLILYTVIAGTLSKTVLFIPEYSYYLHHSIGLMHSVALSILLFLAIMLTSSIRILVILAFTLVSAIFDALYIASGVETFYKFADFRYYNPYSFSNLYSLTEVIFVTYTGFRVIGIRNIRAVGMWCKSHIKNKEESN